MNYYSEIKNELINNEVYKKVKDYSKNRSDLKTYYMESLYGAFINRWYKQNKLLHKNFRRTNLSVRQLRLRMKNNGYERLDDKTKLKLIKKEETKTEDFIKNPILIKNICV